MQWFCFDSTFCHLHVFGCDCTVSSIIAEWACECDRRWRVVVSVTLALPRADASYSLPHWPRPFVWDTPLSAFTPLISRLDSPVAGPRVWWDFYYVMLLVRGTFQECNVGRPTPGHVHFWLFALCFVMCYEFKYLPCVSKVCVSDAPPFIDSSGYWAIYECFWLWYYFVLLY